VASFTSPTPLRSAAPAHNAGAPIIVALPPTTITVPNVPLCASTGRSGGGGNRSTCVSSGIMC